MFRINWSISWIIEISNKTKRDFISTLRLDKQNHQKVATEQINNRIWLIMRVNTQILFFSLHFTTNMTRVMKERISQLFYYVMLNGSPLLQYETHVLVLQEKAETPQLFLFLALCHLSIDFLLNWKTVWPHAKFVYNISRECRRRILNEFY